jgi:hypothetical protein
MTRGLHGALIWTLVLVLIVLAMTGCTRSEAASSLSTSATTSVPLAPSPASNALARTDPAVWAAVRFEQAHCSWDWRQPRVAYVAAQQALATPRYGTQLATQADPVAWRNEVVADRQQVTCTVSAPHRLVGAPSTATSVYVRMSVAEQVSSTMGGFDGGDSIASWQVQRVASRWLVTGTFTGG